MCRRCGMTESEARGFIQGKLNCMERCDRFDCKNTDECDNCEYCYAQGTFGEQTESFSMAINALEKQIPKKPKHTLIKHGKHAWRKKENGEVDDFAWDFEYHNGVTCEVCGETVCVHCNPEYDELTDCEEEYWNCPSCGKKIYYKSKCCDCGQKLNWESDTD